MFKVSVVPLLFIGSALAVNAGTVIATDLSAPVYFNNDIAESEPFGQSFTTGSSAYNLTSATVTLSTGGGLDDARRTRVPAASRSMGPVKASSARSPRKMLSVSGCSSACTQVFLYSDDGGSGPGTLLATSTTTVLDTQLSSSPAQFTFAFNGFTLAAHTRYWIVVASSSTSVAVWWGTNNDTGTSLANEFYFYTDEIFADNEFGYAFLMSVSGNATTISATPIPSSLMLVLIGLLSAGMYLAWRKFSAIS